jgi:hypothetical protein
MSLIKITQLPVFNNINANTQLTTFVGVDNPTDTTFQMSAHTLAQGLYSNETLNVGNNSNTLPNTIAQFALSGNSYIQTNLVNTNDNGSADIVVTANAGSGGTDSAYFIDMGFVNKNYQPGLEFNNIGTAVSPLDGYIYAQGSTGSSIGGNLIVGSTTSNGLVKIIAGGGTSTNIVAFFTKTGLTLNTQSYLTFADGSTQTTAGAPYAYANAAFAAANSAIATNVIQTAIDITQNTNTSAAFTQANSGFTQANSAFAKANNALANTTGTFAGDLTLTGNLTAQSIQSTTGAITTGNLIVSGTANMSGTLNVTGIVNMNAEVVLTNTSFSATQAALTITATPNVAVPSQDGYMIHISGKQNVSSRIVTDSYGANTYVVYAGRSARGNVAYPSAVQAGDVLSRFSGNGYGTTKYQPLGTGRIDFVATENYTDTTTGSQIQFWNCPVGTNTVTQIATFNGVDVTFTGEVNPQKGFVLTPNVLPGIVTSLAIDIANNSLYYFKTNNTTTISLSDFKAGKIVEVWITNTDTGPGSNHTITHGCLANNSTIGATSFTLTSLHSAYIKYFSIDGDQANVFCQVSYS